MKEIHVALLLAIAVMTGCTHIKVPVPTGGSRADGTVELSYKLGSLENAQIDWESVQLTAKQRCAGWGYSNAEQFGGQKSICSSADPRLGCLTYLVTVTYQCTGAPRGAQ